MMTNGAENRTKVLIAHQLEDKETARSFAEDLMVFVYERVTFEFLEENTNQGSWRADLKHKIDETDLLLFLVSSGGVTQDDWQWFTWVSGVAWELANQEVFPIILLYNMGLNPPFLLRDTVEKAYSSEVEDLTQFLKYFLGSPEFTQDRKSLNSALVTQSKTLRQSAQSISNKFSQPNPYLKNKYIFHFL